MAKTIHNSWVTQRMANRLPLWSDARQYQHSVLQQYLNPIGSALEDLYQWSTNERKNLFLPSANMDMIDKVYALRLPSDFQFGTDPYSINAVRYMSPRCKGIIGTQEIWIATAENNSLDNMFYEALPTRVVDLDAYVDVDPVLEETYLSDLETTTPNAICWPSRLAITISDCTTFVDLSRREPFSFLILKGTTVRDLEETEAIIIPYNGTFLTRKIWKELTSLECYGLGPDTAIIQIDCFGFNKDKETDKYQLYVDVATEKLLYHKLATRDFMEGTYSVHQHVTMIANTLGELYNGHDTIQVVKEVELLYEGQNLLLNDIAVQPFTGRLFAIDDSYLYVFDPYANAPSCVGIKDKTPGPMLTIKVQGEKYDYVRGETVAAEAYWRKPIERIYRNRWSIQKPDGTIVYIDIDGNEVPAEDAWIHNKTYTELVFGPFDSSGGEISRQSLSYALSQRGTYLLILETELANGTAEKDIVPIHVHYKEALTRLALPSSLQGARGIAFDADQKLWILKLATGSGYYDAGSAYATTDRAYRVHLAIDQMVVDFVNKVIFLHEKYDSVEVEEISDMMVEV